MKNGAHLDKLEEEFKVERSALTKQIYKAFLPPYMEESWESGRGKWYEDWLREQLDILVMSEVDDLERLEELRRRKEIVSLIFGIFGAAFRILDHMGMHLRGQTLGQYELLPEDKELLHGLCYRLLIAKQSDMDLFTLLNEKIQEHLD